MWKGDFITRKGKKSRYDGSSKMRGHLNGIEIGRLAPKREERWKLG